MIKALTEETKHPAAVMLGRLGGLATSPRKRRAQRKNLEKGRRMLARKRKAARAAAQKEAGISPGKWVFRQYLHQRRFPEQTKARQLVTEALKAGHLRRGPCEVCGNATTEAHHDDYTVPLSVRWLCVKHHKAWHANQ